jgi:hypothetical protein
MSLANLELFYSMPQCIDQFVTCCCTALQRIHAPQQLFHGGFLLLLGWRLRQSWARKQCDGHNTAKGP